VNVLPDDVVFVLVVLRIGTGWQGRWNTRSLTTQSVSLTTHSATGRTGLPLVWHLIYVQSDRYWSECNMGWERITASSYRGILCFLNDIISYADVRWRTLLSVDDLVETVVKALDDNKLLDSTYVIFMSDNGFHLGVFTYTMWHYVSLVCAMAQCPSVCHKVTLCRNGWINQAGFQHRDYSWLILLCVLGGIWDLKNTNTFIRNLVQNSELSFFVVAGQPPSQMLST